MKPKLLVGLVAAALLAVGGAYIAWRSATPEAPAAVAGQRVFPDLAAKGDALAAIVVTRPDGSFRVVRQGDRWVVPDKSSYPASADRVGRLLIGLSELRLLERKSSSPDLYPSMEVEDPTAPGAKSVQVTLEDSGGAPLLSVIVGKQRMGRGPNGDSVFIRRSGEGQALLAQGRLLVERDPAQWLDRSIADVRRERVREVAIDGDPGVRVTRASVDDKDFTLADIPPDRKPKSSWDVNNVAGLFESLELDDVAPLSAIGDLGAAPRATLVTFDGLRVTAAFVERDGATWVHLQSAFEAPQAEVAAKEGGPLKSADAVAREAATINDRAAAWVYKLPAYKAEALRRTLNDLTEEKKES